MEEMDTMYEVQCIEYQDHFEVSGPSDYDDGDHVGYECPACGEEEVIVVCKCGEL